MDHQNQTILRNGGYLEAIDVVFGIVTGKHKRWYRIDEERLLLTWGNSEEVLDPLGSLSLTTAAQCAPDLYSDHSGAFVIRVAGNVYRFCAPSAQQRDFWVQAVHTATKCCEGHLLDWAKLGTHQRIRIEEIEFCGYINAGASGQVYEGRWMDASVALKTLMIPPGKKAGEVLNSIMNEVQLLRELQGSDYVMRYHCAHTLYTIHYTLYTILT
jgi:hypothetical protein